MASKFKIGDRVKCITADNGNCLTNGKIYTIADTSNEGALVVVANDAGTLTDYFPSRFALVPRVPETDLKQLDEWQLVNLRERINQKLIEKDWEEKRRAKLDVTRGEFEDLKAAAVNAPK